MRESACACETACKSACGYLEDRIIVGLKLIIVRFKLNIAAQLLTFLYVNKKLFTIFDTIGGGDFGRFISHWGHFLTNFHYVPCKI